MLHDKCLSVAQIHNLFNTNIRFRKFLRNTSSMMLHEQNVFRSGVPKRIVDFRVTVLVFNLASYWVLREQPSTFNKVLMDAIWIQSWENAKVLDTLLVY